MPTKSSISWPACVVHTFPDGVLYLLYPSCLLGCLGTMQNESESESDNKSTTVRVLPLVMLLCPTEKFDSSEDSLLLEDELFDDDDERGTWVVAW